LLLFSRVGIANFSKKKKMLQNKEKSKEARQNKKPIKKKEELNCFGNSMVV